MPELPEMETYKVLLNQHIVAQPITDVIIGREKSINMAPETFASRLVGRQIIYVERRAKHLLFHLDDGMRLLLHLMLGGWMYYGSDSDQPNRTKQVEIAFGENRLYFIGLRLGYLHLITAKEAIENLQQLGPEPIHTTLTVERFRQLLNRKRGALKPALVDQRFIAGIGNCYADEICFEAEINPMIQAAELNSDEMDRLYGAMRLILDEAIKYGGYIEDRFMRTDEWTGGYNERCRVYDREGEPCPRCSEPIVRGEVSSRKTFYCARCQHGK